MPRMNAFDFVERPSHRLDRERDNDQGRGQSSGHEKIKKVMTGIKRQSKTSLVNRKLETVKFNQWMAPNSKLGGQSDRLEKQSHCKGHRINL